MTSPTAPRWSPTVGTIILVIVLVVCVILALPIPVEGKPGLMTLGLIAAVDIACLLG